MEEIREEEGISLLDIIYRIKKHIIFIIVSIVLCIGAMGVYSLAFQKTKYVATSKLVMNANDDLPGTSGLNYSLNIIPSYQEYLASEKVKKRAIEIAGVDENTPFSLSTNNKTGTIMIEISITSYDPIVSVKLANAYVTASIDIINENPEGSLKSLAQAEPGPLDEAREARVSNNNLIKNCVIGAAAGVVVACGYVFVRVLIDNLKEEAKRKDEKNTETPVA